jgi:hypothetical protein
MGTLVSNLNISEFTHTTTTKANYSLRKLVSKDILYIFMFLTAITPMTFSFTPLILPLCFIYTAILFWFLKRKVDSILLIVLLLWFLINGISLISYGGDYASIPRGFYRQTMNIIFPYMVLKILGPRFYYVLEDWIFRLSLISLPIFLFQTINKSFFYSIAPYFSMVTGVQQRLAGGWYGGFYTFSAWANFRNCGFMWEPGGFAFILIVAALIRFHRNGLKFDTHVWVYLICIITTFSTTGYLVGFWMILTMLAKRAKYIFPVFVIPVLVFVFYTNIWGLDFLGPKIRMFFDTVNVVGRENEFVGRIARVNRISIFFYTLQQSFQNPLGSGIFPIKGFIDEFGEMIYGPNTLAIVILKWGLAGFFLFVYAVYRTIKKLFYQESAFVCGLLLVAILMMLFSNTLDRNMIVISFVFYSYIKQPQELYINAQYK